jgi:hypothetical protein
VTNVPCNRAIRQVSFTQCSDTNVKLTESRPYRSIEMFPALSCTDVWCDGSYHVGVSVSPLTSVTLCGGRHTMSPVGVLGGVHSGGRDLKFDD